MTFINRWLHKSQRWLTILFGGLVVTGTLYLILKPLPPAPQPKRRTKQELDAIDKWSKKDLFGYLSKHQVYPDVETTQPELVRLVKSIIELYPDMDSAA